MRKSVWIIAILVIISILGCSHTLGAKIDAEKLAMIKKGETTKAQVLSILGQPYQKHLSDNIESFMYMYYSASPGIGFGMGSSEHQSVSISFDEKGIVESVSSSSGGR
jgi:outer membrane protein assembly factor BamE (lipoprotein component of BamABCDE complex)